MSGNWFDYIDRKTAPKPSHKRPAPAASKVKGMALNARVTEVDRRAQDGIEVEETDASDSMIMRIIGKIRGAGQ